MCHCGAVVKELLAPADKPGSTPGDAVFCFFVLSFFSVWSLFNTIFPFGLFFFVFTADPAGHALGTIYILSVSPEFFGKRDFKSPVLICILANLTARKKKHELSRHVPPLKQLNFFQC